MRRKEEQKNVPIYFVPGIKDSGENVAEGSILSVEIGAVELSPIFPGPRFRLRNGAGYIAKKESYVDRWTGVDSEAGIDRTIRRSRPSTLDSNRLVSFFFPRRAPPKRRDLKRRN